MTSFAVRADAGLMFRITWSRDVAAKAVATEEAEEHHPYSGKTLPRATLYTDTTSSDLQTWLQDVSSRKENVDAGMVGCDCFEQ